MVYLLFTKKSQSVAETWRTATPKNVEEWKIDNCNHTPTFSYPPWSHTNWSSEKPVTTFEYNFRMAPWPTIPSYFTMPMPLETPTREWQNALLLTISLVVRVVLFTTCLVQNSIAIFILRKSLRNGRKTFALFTLISVACSNNLSALV